MQGLSCGVNELFLMRIGTRKRFDEFREFKATIVSINRASKLAVVEYTTTATDITLPTEDIPFFYHCQFSSWTEAALGYGHLAFEVDDVVMVRWLPATDTDPEEVYICGHADTHDVKKCSFEKIVLRIALETSSLDLPDIGRTFITIYDPDTGTTYINDGATGNYMPSLPVMVASDDEDDPNLINPDVLSSITAYWEPSIAGTVIGDWPTASIVDSDYAPWNGGHVVDHLTSSFTISTDVDDSNSTLLMFDRYRDCDQYEDVYYWVYNPSGAYSVAGYNYTWTTLKESGEFTTSDTYITEIAALSEFTYTSEQYVNPQDESYTIPPFVIFSSPYIFAMGEGTTSKNKADDYWPVYDETTFYEIDSVIDGVLLITERRSSETYRKVEYITEPWILPNPCTYLSSNNYYLGKIQITNVSTNQTTIKTFKAPWDISAFSSRGYLLKAETVTTKEELADEELVSTSYRADYMYSNETAIWCGEYGVFAASFVLGFQSAASYNRTTETGPTTYSLDNSLIDISVAESLNLDMPGFIDDGLYNFSRITSANHPKGMASVLRELLEHVCNYLQESVEPLITTPNLLSAFLNGTSLTFAVYGIKEAD
jgi:hypothetical protein